MSNKITTFIFQGQILQHDGSIFSLKTQVSSDEWLNIVVDTVKYAIYLECMKQAVNLLEDNTITWTTADDEYITQLRSTVSSIIETDPISVSNIDQNKIRNDYFTEMRKNIVLLKNQISIIKAVSGRIISNL